MNAADTIASLMLIALVLYAVLAGADFGGGVWDLLATGPRATDQRKLIDDAIAPVWEANHVWLIFVVVMLFSAFPSAFSALATGLHIPLTLVLLGIVFRGSAYVFRKYGSDDAVSQRRWSRVFAIASTITPLLLGAVVATITAGELDIVDGLPVGDFLFAWVTSLSLCVGLFALSLFAFISAVFLILEANDDDMREVFRKKALATGVVVGALALLTALVAGPAAEPFTSRLLGSWWSWPLQGATGVCALGTFWMLTRRSYVAARAMACAQVALIVIGWGAAQYPFLIAPDLTVDNAAAPDVVLNLLAPILLFGTLALSPAIYWLFHVFKPARPRATSADP